MLMPGRFAAPRKIAIGTKPGHVRDQAATGICNVESDDVIFVALFVAVVHAGDGYSVISDGIANDLGIIGRFVPELPGIDGDD